VANRCRRNLIRLVEEYHTTVNNAQELREIRNEMDESLRRYHEYCIQQRDGMKAHYHEVGADAECDFEHLIPASRIRDLLLAGVITTEQGLNAPTVRLSRAKHMALKDAGWASKTPNMWLPFQRYTNVFAAVYETHDGTVINPETWTLEQHYAYFRHLVL
jgi:exopolyphosphatase/pppGpp-phosphohydrolase